VSGKSLFPTYQPGSSGQGHNLATCHNFHLQSYCDNMLHGVLEGVS
jgi:hypothetical protein